MSVCTCEDFDGRDCRTCQSNSEAGRQMLDAQSAPLHAVIDEVRLQSQPTDGLESLLREAECPGCAHTAAHHSLRNPPCDLCDCPYDRWAVTACTVRTLIRLALHRERGDA